MLLPSGYPFKCHEKVLYLQPMIPSKRFDIVPSDLGMLRRRSRCIQIFLLNSSSYFMGIKAKKEKSSAMTFSGRLFSGSHLIVFENDNFQEHEFRDAIIEDRVLENRRSS